MPPRTAAERQRRYRERQKSSAGPVRAFLEGVINDANNAVEEGDCPPWLLARSATAIEVLESMGQVEEERPAPLQSLIALGRGATTSVRFGANPRTPKVESWPIPRAQAGGVRRGRYQPEAAT